MNKLPLAKNTNLVIQNTGQEILIYNLKINKAFCLNETLATVYQACDGKTTFDELKAKTKFTDDVIYLSLDELHKQDFIDDNSEYVSPFTGMSRREVIRKVGLASMIALPVMTSLVAPTSANAQSACVTSGQLCSSTPLYAQGNCCDPNQRCFNQSGPDRCSACVTSGNVYLQSFGNLGTSGCVSRQSYNRCCNNAGATATYDAGSNITTCRCA